MPVELGNAIDWFCDAFDVRVVVKPEPPVNESTPVFETVNWVVPDDEAVSMSPLFVWLTISVAFDPIPPDIESGAGVVAPPIKTDVSESADKIMSPVPFGVRVRFEFDPVVIEAGDVPPRERVVESIERDAAASIVASEEALIVVRPLADRVVSELSIVKVLSPEFKVSVFVVDAIVPAPANVSESMSRTVPSTETKPAFASSFIVTEPFDALTSNSSKLIAVAPPLI